MANCYVVTSTMATMTSGRPYAAFNTRRRLIAWARRRPKLGTCFLRFYRTRGERVDEIKDVLRHIWARESSTGGRFPGT